jgi:hypothetical protein
MTDSVMCSYLSDHKFNKTRGKCLFKYNPCMNICARGSRYECIILAFVSMNFFDAGGLILLKPDYGTPLQFAATAAFLSKLYSDYLDLMRSTGRRCGS